MPLTLVTPAVAEPVTLDEVKAHLRIGFDHDDDLLLSMIGRATGFLRKNNSLVTVRETWKQSFRASSVRDAGAWLPLALWPASSISSVKYYDADDTLTTVSSGDYYAAGLTMNPPCVVPKSGGWGWGLSASHPLPIEVTYVAGFGDAGDVPQMVKDIVTLLVTHAYEQRNAVDPGNYYQTIPWGLKAMLDLYSPGWLR